jgi:hypothetical protein
MLAAMRRTQPIVGLAGLTFVVPVFLVLAFGPGLGPLCTFALPVIAMVAFWWQDWPGSTLRLTQRAGKTGAVVVLTGLLYGALASVHAKLDDLWIANAALNGVGVAIILHVAIWQRWPVVTGPDRTTRNMIPSPVQALLDAANANDIDAFLAGFTENGVVDDWGREFRGADKIRVWSDKEFIGKQVSLDVETSEDHDGETVVTAQVGGNGFNGPSHFSFRVDGDLVSRMTIRA